MLLKEKSSDEIIISFLYRSLFSCFSSLLLSLSISYFLSPFLSPSLSLSLSITMTWSQKVRIFQDWQSKRQGDWVEPKPEFINVSFFIPKLVHQHASDGAFKKFFFFTLIFLYFNCTHFINAFLGRLIDVKERVWERKDKRVRKRTLVDPCFTTHTSHTLLKGSKRWDFRNKWERCALCYLLLSKEGRIIGRIECWRMKWEQRCREEEWKEVNEVRKEKNRVGKEDDGTEREEEWSGRIKRELYAPPFSFHFTLLQGKLYSTLLFLHATER